jgi:hypothetical protein
MKSVIAFKWVLVLSAVAVLAACSEKPQTNASGVKTDVPAYQGVGQSPFADSGWQAGDRNSWEQRLRFRAAYGQNEYTRVH